MFKILIQLILCILLIFKHAEAETITSVEVLGNKRISKETIMVLADISLNNEINNNLLNDKLKKLYQSDFFKDIKFNFKEGKLEIFVQENPIIGELIINGIKKKSLEEILLKNIKLKNRMSFSEVQLDKDIFTIYNILKTNGYYFANINSSLDLNENINSVKVTLNIELGNKAKINEIVFLGDKKIKDKKLLEIIASEENKFWKFVSNKVYLNNSLIDLDKRLLLNFYRNQGYYEVKIFDSFAELDKEGLFKLVYNIDSGKKFFFNNFTLSLPVDYNKKDFIKIEKIFNDLKNENYSIQSITRILDEIDTIAALKLYDFINAEVEETIVDGNRLNFDFKIVESKKFYVEKINIFGNYNTYEEVIRNQLAVDEGDPFNEILFNKSINQIKSLDIFSKVDSEVIKNENKNLNTININVEEKPTGEISLGAGYGTSGAVVGGSIVEKNFLGKGVTLNTDLELSTQGVKGKLTYVKPNFNYTDNTLFTSIKSTSTDYLSDYGYKRKDIGFSLGTKFEQYANLYFSPELDFSIEKLETNSNASTSLKKQEGNYEDFYFNYSVDYDLRDSSFNTTSGIRTTFSQEVPIISNNYELSNILEITKYQSLNSTSDMIGKASIFLKKVNSINGNDTRISKRAFVPYNRLRGFEKGKVGPIDNSDHIGGNNIIVLNLSTNLPNIFPTLENLDFNYFVDVANIWGVDYDSTIDDSNYFRSSTGIGLNFLTPIGPLSFSLTQPITKKSSDKAETFRFNLGTTF